jgi:hypothetical protein
MILFMQFTYHGHVYGMNPSPLLLWALGLAVCASLLLVLVLLMLATWRRRHVSGLFRFCTLLSLMACVTTALAAYHFFATYASWNASLHATIEIETTRGSDITYALVQAYKAILNENQQAMLVGAVGVVVTSVLLVLGFGGMWRLGRKSIL